METDMANLFLSIDEDEQSRWFNIRDVLTSFYSYFVVGKVPKLEILNVRSAGIVMDSNSPDTLTGVYLLFNRDNQLLYIGYTSDRLSSRLRNHEKTFEWYHEDIIVIEPEFRWLACGLERFLIDELHPRFNER